MVRRRVRPQRALLTVACLLGLLASMAPRPALPVLAAANPIVTENQQPGSSGWQLGSRIAYDTVQQIKGYASATSVLQGDSLNLYITVNPAQNYNVDIYRVGWYGGLGGRLRLHAGPIGGVTQPACPIDATTGLIACSWTPSYTLTIPSDWTSGVYLAVLTNAGGYQNYVVFVVRDGRPAPFLFQHAVNTDEAYNNYPNDGTTGKSLYDYNSFGANTVAGTTRAVKVSFDRPFSNNGAGVFLNWEIQFIRWAERSGYDVTYSTDVDTHANGSELLNHKAFLSGGHDEYWSNEMYNAAQGARDAGVSLAFLGSDPVYRQVRYEASAAGVPNRVLVHYRLARLDPVQGPTTTTQFRDGPVNRPEQALVGVQFTSSVNFGSNVAYAVTNSLHWAYAGTGLHDADSVPGLVGYEMDRFMPNYPAPNAVSRTLLSQSPFTDSGGVADYSNSSIYQAPSGAWVFATGTMSWSWGLDDFNNAGIRTGIPTDPRIQQTMANILNAFLYGPPSVHDLKVTAPGTATVGQAFSITVTAEDAQGNPVTAYRGTVHFSSSDTSSSVVLPPNSTLTNGQGTFSVTLARAGPQTLTVSDAASALSTTVNLTMNAQSAGKLVLAAATTTPTAGTSFAFTVTAQDAWGNTDPTYAGTVRFATSDTSAGVVLPPDSTLTSGQGTFSGTLTRAGAQTLTASDAVNAFSSTANLTVNAAPASKLLLSTATATPASGTSFNVTVSAQDPFGNSATSYAATVHFSSSDTASGVALPPDSTLSGGQGTFSATLITTGPQTLTASDAANALSATANLTVNPSTALHDLKLAAPTNPTAGQAFTISVTAEDAQGNPVTSYSGSVHFASSDTTAVLPPDSGLTSGQGSFSAMLTKAGPQTLTVSDAANALSTTVTPTVNAASAGTLLLVASTAAPTAGTSFSFTVTAQDRYGNTATGYAGTVHFGSSDTSPGVLLPPNSTLTSGQGSFSATLIKAGPQTLTASDAANALSATASLTVNTAPAGKLVLATATSAPTAGTSFSFTVTAQDPYGNTATSYGGTVHFSSSDASSGVALPANSTLTSGQGTFSATLIKAGLQTLTASDAANAFSATASLTVNAAPASKLVLATSTNAPTAGSSFSFTVTAQDPFSNTATSYAGTVHFGSSDASSGVVVPADSTLTSGQGSFSAKLIRAGPQTLTASDAANSLSATTNLTVNAAPASKLTLSTGTSAPTAGTGFSFTVTAQDPYSNTATSYAGTVHFSSSDTSSGVALPPNSTLTSGTRSFSATLIKAGPQTLTGSDAANGLSATTNLTVNAAPASKLVLSPTTTTATAGISFLFTMTAQDPYGNTAKGYAGTLHFSSSDTSTGVVLPPNSTLTNGTRTFSATLDRAGTQTVTAVDMANGSLSAILTIQVTAGSAATVKVAVPSSVVMNRPFNATVTLTDNFGNVATGYTGTVHFTSSDLVAQTLGDLPPDYTFTAADAGTRVFSMTLATPPSETITVSDTANGSLSATSPPITVTLV